MVQASNISEVKYEVSNVVRALDRINTNLDRIHLELVTKLDHQVFSRDDARSVVSDLTYIRSHTSRTGDPP